MQPLAPWVRVCLLINIFCLLTALFQMPYQYYMLLRVIVASVCVFAAFEIYKQSHNSSWVIVFLMIAIIYNPIFPVRLGREVWAIVNLGTIAVFVYALKLSRKNGP